ncbi:TonB-dependent receptor [Polycladidibacter hongkongensis]|uniref:TonB-dependent receptor n=1 Tax=Polycladidibacter hongkongensis TaxID=1647556 RepID=UPI00082E384A|nr:TonB-dependent receptor [Pseudovibrio hongkongensis]
MFVDDKLTLGGRVSHTAERAIGHGKTTANPFISLVNWDRHTLVDLFSEYKLNENVSLTMGVDNVTDQYYIDPLGMVNMPGPGHRFHASMKAQF